MLINNNINLFKTGTTEHKIILFNSISLLLLLLKYLFKKNHKNLLNLQQLYQKIFQFPFLKSSQFFYCIKQKCMEFIEHIIEKMKKMCFYLIKESDLNYKYNSKEILMKSKVLLCVDILLADQYWTNVKLTFSENWFYSYKLILVILQNNILFNDLLYSNQDTNSLINHLKKKKSLINIPSLYDSIFQMLNKKKDLEELVNTKISYHPLKYTIKKT